MFMSVPLRMEVRKRTLLPIVEVKVEALADVDVSYWINCPLDFIDKGEKAGGRLIPEEPNEKLKPNTVFFTMIFESEKQSMDFMRFLQNG